MAAPQNVVVRIAYFPQDIGAVESLDLSIVAPNVLRVDVGARSFTLTESKLALPTRKNYEIDTLLEFQQNPLASSFVAELAGQIVGFAAGRLHTWNRRYEVCHLYVDRVHRGHGTGKRLLSALQTEAIQRNCRQIWAETQNTNPDAVNFYENCGFRFCGFDDSLYDGLSETALFFCRDLPGLTLEP